MRYTQLIRPSLLLILSACISSCSLFDRNLAKRYRNVNENIFDANTGNAQNFVDIGLNSSLIKDGTASTPVYNLFSLAPEGQAELIKSIDNNTANLKELIDQITTNFSFNKEAKPNIKIIGNTVSRSLVFTVDRKFAVINAAGTTAIVNGKADRIDFLELQLDIPTASPATFNSWDRFVTKFANLDLGKVSQSQQFSAALNLNANAGTEATLTGSNTTEAFDSNKETSLTQMVGPSGTNTATNNSTGELITTGKTNGVTGTSAKVTAGLGASGNLTYSDKYETSLDLRSRIIDLSGSLSDKKMIIRQESGPGLDLSGNQTIILDYALSEEWKVARFAKFKELYANGLPLSISSLKNNYLTVIFPDIKNDVIGKMSYQFLYRQVNKGSRHIPEARQKVTYKFGQVGKIPSTPAISVILIKKSDIRPKAYELSTPANVLLVNGHQLVFETVLDAENFLHYLGALLELPHSNLSQVTINGAPLTPTLFKAFTIKINQL